ncbi:MAG: flagellar biosynthesis protein FlhB [Gemmobacter sp.]
MNSEQDDSQDKPHEPTERRLDEARRKGDVPRSPDLAMAFGTAGFLIAAGVFGAAIADGAGRAGQVLLAEADRLAPLASRGAKATLGGYLVAVGGAIAVLFALPFALTLAAIFLQGPLVASPERIAPKLSRISPVTGFGNKFGKAALVAFAKNTVKMVAVAATLGMFLAGRAPDVIAAVSLDARVSMGMMMRLLLEFVAIVLAIQAAIGALDLFWQRHHHRSKLRMSHRDLREELRQSEGDPQLRATRRQRAVAIATNRMLSDVDRADVVIVNPTHYAVALRWDRLRPQAPICVAKGVDAVAMRIRQRAEAAGVPLRHDPPAARALHAAVEIGEEIRPDHYRAVAAAIRFAEAMRRRARERGGR